jgi:hypothetical protein
MGFMSQLMRAVTAQEAVNTGVVFSLMLPDDTGRRADEEAWHDVAALEHAVKERLAETGLGELDWHDVALDGHELRVFISGPDPDALFEALYPVIESRGSDYEPSYALLRYGAHGTGTRITLS